MRALLITPEGIQEVEIGMEVEKLVRLIESNPEPVPKTMTNLHSMYRLIECDTVTGAGYPDDVHACWADDDGISKITDGTQVNVVSWHPERLVGKLLVTGFDPETGETTSATLSVEELSSMVKVGTFVLRKNQ